MQLKCDKLASDIEMISRGRTQLSDPPKEKYEKKQEHKTSLQNKNKTESKIQTGLKDK